MAQGIPNKIVQGYRPDEYSEKDYIFGSGQAPSPIILPSGNWRTIQLITEFQNKGFETYGCVTFTILNALEKLAKVVFGEDWNKSERFTYIASGTDPANRGNSPRTVADSVRKQGTVNELDLPFDDSIDTLEKFNSPRPLTNSLLEKGKVFLDNYIFNYDYLSQTDGQISRDTLKEALKRSPVAIAVYAWAEKDGVYIRQGEDTHLTLLENVKDNGELEIFDSYSPAQKTLSKDFPIYVAMRIHIEPNRTPQQISIFQQILNLLKKILTLDLEFLKPKPIEPLIPIDSEIPPPAPSIIPPAQPVQPVQPRTQSPYDFTSLQGSESSARLICSEEGLSPELTKITIATIWAESGMNPSKVSPPNKNGTRDWGICQFNDGKNKQGIPLWIGQGATFKDTYEVVNNPEKCVRIMVKEVKRGKITWWAAYNNGSYKNYL